MSGIKTKLLSGYKPEGTWGNSAGDMFQNFYKTGGVTGTTTGPAPVNPTIAAPTAEVGGAIPYVMGRSLIVSANVIWVGNLDPIYESVSESKSESELYYTFGPNATVKHWEVTKTTVVTTTYVAGYHIDCHIGLCLGPDVKLVGIYYNNEKIWSGSLGPERSTVTIPDNDTAIGGATVIFHGGAFDQTVDPTVVDADMPAYVGVAYVIIQHIRADSPLQNLQFEVERFPNVLSLASGDNKYNNDLNVASAIADIITNSWGGAGLSTDSINLTNFSSVAGGLQDELNGCSVVSYGDSVKAMISYLLQQIYGTLYQNPETGKLELNLIRSEPFEVTPDNNFSTTNVVALRNFSKTSWSNTVGKISGAYTNRDDGYKPGSMLVQNLDVDSSKIVSANYPYITNSDLLLSVLSRDLGLSSSPLFTLSFEATRQAAGLLPGDVVFLSWGEFGIYGVPVIVSKVRKLPMDKNTVIVEANQYQLPQITPVYEIPADPPDPYAVIEPEKPQSVLIMSAPYWMAKAAGVTSTDVSTEADTPIFLPVPANNLQSSFSAIAYYAGVGGIRQVVEVDRSIYPTYGKLGAAVDKYDGWTTGVIDEITLTNVTNVANLREVGEEGARKGEIFLIVGNEIMSFESVALTGANEYTLYTCRRGLLDTVAESHAADAEVFVISNNFRNVSKTLFNYPITGGDLGAHVPWSILSNVTNKRGSLDNSDSYIDTTSWQPTECRLLSPPRPHDTKIEGVRNSEPTDIFLGSDVTVTWKTRPRTDQSVSFQTDAAGESELLSTGEYQYHVVMLIDGGGVERIIERTPEDADVTYNSLEATLPSSGITLGDGYLFVRSKLTFESGTYESRYDDMLPVRILPDGVLISEDGADYLVSEDGNSYLIQE